jgi:hypothetical protein
LTRAKDDYADWPLARSMTAALPRLEAGRDPLNSDLTALIQPRNSTPSTYHCGKQMV